MPLSLNSIVSQASNCLAADVDGEAVLMMMNSGNYYALDPVGSDIWARISDPKAVVELCNDLKLEYDAPRERIERDVLTLLGDLVAAGAVEIKS